MNDQELAEVLHCLEAGLTLRPAPVGFIRRAILAPELYRWRGARGNSVLEILGSRSAVGLPGGSYFDFYLFRGKYVLQYRGGNFRDWWLDDVREVLALVMMRTSLPIEGCVLVQELDGKLSLQYIRAPDFDTAEKSAALTLHALETLGRIRKDSPRARVICPTCPAFDQCMLLDLERGETSDWRGIGTRHG